MLTSKKFWLPILLAFATYIGVYVTVFMPVGSLDATVFSPRACCCHIIFAPARVFAIICAYIYFLLPEVANNLIQFLGYGIVIGIAWYKNKLKWFLICLIIVHLASIAIMFAGFFWFFSRL